MILDPLRKFFGYDKSSGRRPGHLREARPTLEVLENRLAPAMLHVGSAPGEYHQIQAAVLAANPGDTIKVDPGTYTEQVKIDTNSHGVTLNNLDLQGANDKSIIMLPLAPGNNTSTAIVEITGAKNVTIEKLTIQGPGGPPGSIGYGIEVDGAGSANITNVLITDIRDNPVSGDQNGVAIQVGLAPETTGTATISHDTIDDYQKAGIVVDNTGSSAEIDHTTITGIGPTAVIAQNGIQISNGAIANVNHDTISGNVYTPPTFAGTGILLAQAGAVTVDQNMLSQNDVAIYVLGPTGMADIEQNQISGSTFDGIDLDGVSGAYLSQNQIANSGGDGIALFDGSTHNDVDQNQCKNGYDGIFVDVGSTGNTFNQNQLQNNAHFDAEDLTTGTGTKGTGNTWTRNHGRTSSPTGLVS